MGKPACLPTFGRPSTREPPCAQPLRLTQRLQQVHTGVNLTLLSGSPRDILVSK